MSLHTRPDEKASPRDAESQIPTALPVGPGPVTRVIAVSLLVGAVAALILTMVLFPGAPEAAVTGSILVGFALGWTLLAILTQARTARPQGWAFIPATVMGVTGLGLLVFSPGTATMTVLNWCWPPVMFALAIWCFVRMRRSLPGRPGRGGRWLLTPVLVALAVASVGGVYADVTVDEDPYPATGHVYDVSGHRVHLDCRGHGSPTVVLSNGLGESSTSWDRIASPVAATTRVCAFDRPGQGWSQATEHPEDGVASARMLHATLAAAGEHGPFVLVGHSTGGPYAMIFAARYPQQVAGMVLLDSSSPQQFDRMPAYPTQYALMRRGFALMPTLYRLGLNRVLAATPNLPVRAAHLAHAVATTPSAAQSARDELSLLPEVFTQAQALTTLGHRPLEVLTASENRTEGWLGAQRALTALSLDGVHRTVHATHAGMVEDPGPAAQATRAITAVISAVRSGTPLHTP